MLKSYKFEELLLKFLCNNFFFLKALGRRGALILEAIVTFANLLTTKYLILLIPIICFTAGKPGEEDRVRDRPLRGVPKRPTQDLPER